MKYSDELMHFGIKGMHWGVRRTPGQLGHKKGIRAKAKRALAIGEENEYQKHSRPVTATKTKKARTLDQKLNNELADLSDDELKQLVNRMNLERQYKDLRTQDINRGKSEIQKFVERNTRAVLDQEFQNVIRTGVRAAKEGPAAAAGEFVGRQVARGLNR